MSIYYTLKYYLGLSETVGIDADFFDYKGKPDSTTTNMWTGLTKGFHMDVNATGATIDKKFGLNDSLSSWSLTHNRQDLPALNQVTIDEFAYGQQQGSIAVDFTLSNPWIFRSILGTPSKTGSADPYFLIISDPEIEKRLAMAEQQMAVNI